MTEVVEHHPAAPGVPAHTTRTLIFPGGKQRVSLEAAIPARDSGPAGLAIFTNSLLPFNAASLDARGTEGFHFVIFTVPLSPEQRARVLATIENGADSGDPSRVGELNTATGYYDRLLSAEALAAPNATVPPFTPAVREHMVRLAKDAAEARGPPCSQETFLAFVDPATVADGKATLIEIAIGLEDEEQPAGEVKRAVRVPLDQITGYFLQTVVVVTLDMAVPPLGPEQPVEPLPPLPVPSHLMEPSAADQH